MMIKKILLLAIAMVGLTSLNLAPALAQGGLVVADSSARAEFPARLAFHLETRSDQIITDVRLRYTVEQTQFAPSFSEAFIEIAPSKEVKADWALDMVKIGGLPPGTDIDYFWLIRDASGKQNITEQKRISFDDSRYAWQSVPGEKFSISWYAGDSAFAGELVKIAESALTRLADYTGARLERPVRIYVYGTSADLRGAMIFPQEWTGGVAFTRFGVVSLTIRPGDLAWAKQVIPHELTHQVIHQVVLNPYNDLPTWLDEGLAMLIEGAMAQDLKGYLTAALAENKLIHVRSLGSPFSALRDKAALSYAQSHSLVDFLVTRYGQAKMLELLETFRRGSSYDAAFMKVYGFDLDGLDAAWRKHVGATERQGVTAAVIR